MHQTKKLKYFRGPKLRSAALFSIALLASLPCFAQSEMNFSTYTVASLSDDGQTLYNGVTIQDSSTGCTHSSYTTYSEIENPDGTDAESSASGLVANTDISIDGIAGDYTLVGAVTYYCSCIQNIAGAGGSATVPLQHIQAYYYYTGSYNQGQGVYKRCNPIGSTCDTCSITIGSPSWAYGLFDGAEIHVGTANICAMAALESVSGCFAPDPVPGTGGGIWASAKRVGKTLARSITKGAGVQKAGIE
jgi:hypothetical protein